VFQLVALHARFTGAFFIAYDTQGGLSMRTYWLWAICLAALWPCSARSQQDAQADKAMRECTADYKIQSCTDLIENKYGQFGGETVLSFAISRSYAHAAAGNFSQAVKELDFAIGISDHYPPDANNLRPLAALAVQLQQWPVAYELFGALLKLDPHDLAASKGRIEALRRGTGQK
jgi:tetratricopeptide (TPR) repeat protein